MTGVIAFAFGQPSSSSANLRLREIVVSLSLPTFTQPDLKVEMLDCECIQEPGGVASPTLRIARQSAAWADRKGITELIVVAAKPHLNRALRDVRVAIRESDLSITAVAHPIPSHGWFDSDSTMARARNPVLFWIRELILLSAPMCIYKRIAS